MMNLNKKNITPKNDEETLMEILKKVDKKMPEEIPTRKNPE